MTKKHFIALADMIKAHNRAMSSRGDSIMDMFHEEQKEALADFCKSQNPRFNRERWLDYLDDKCGPNGGQVKKAKRENA